MVRSRLRRRTWRGPGSIRPGRASRCTRASVKAQITARSGAAKRTGRPRSPRSTRTIGISAPCSTRFARQGNSITRCSCSPATPDGPGRQEARETGQATGREREVQEGYIVLGGGGQKNKELDKNKQK